jgi:hypothetical protein
VNRCFGGTYRLHLQGRKKRLAVEAPPSAILTEIYLQLLEHKNIYNTHIKLKIIGYFIYADDMLLIYNEKLTDINLMLQEFNNIKPNLKFMIEEKNNKNKFPIHNNTEDNNLSYNIYRKPTTIDTMHSTLCHPVEHKMSAISYLINRLNIHPMEENTKNTEKNAIKYILQQNQIHKTEIKQK